MSGRPQHVPWSSRIVDWLYSLIWPAPVACQAAPAQQAPMTEGERLDLMRPGWRQTVGAMTLEQSNNQIAFVNWVRRQPQDVQEIAGRNARIILDAQAVASILELYEMDRH